MTEKDQKFITYWEQKKKRGRYEFALLHGVIFGILFFTMFAGFSYLTNDFDFFRPSYILSFLTTTTVIGIFYEGGYTWWANSRRYRKLTQNKMK